MTLIPDFYKECYNYRGRATRKDMLFFAAIQFFLGIAVGVIMRLAGRYYFDVDVLSPEQLKMQIALTLAAWGKGRVFFLLGLWIVFNFVVFVAPWITMTIRRLHDLNRSGWHVLWVYGLPFALPYGVVYVSALTQGAVPLDPTYGICYVTIAFVYLCLFVLKRGTVGVNRFGPDQVEINRAFKERQREKRLGL